jgi:hypothetical protein
MKFKKLRPNRRYLITKSSKDKTFLVGDSIYYTDDGYVEICSRDYGKKDTYLLFAPKHLNKSLKTCKFKIDKRFYVNSIKTALEQMKSYLMAVKGI